MSDIINLQFSFSAGPAAANYNKLIRPLTTPFALLDDAGGATGLTAEETTSFTSHAGNTGYSGGDQYGIPENVFKAAWYTNAVGGSEITIDGTIPAGKQIKTITLTGSSNQSDGLRIGNHTIGAASNLHDARDSGAAAPVVFNINSATLPLVINSENDTDFAYVSGVIIELESVASGPTITGPDTTTEGAVTVATGTLLDTVTTFSLISGSNSVVQTIDSATATTLNYVARSGVSLCTPSTLVAGLPLEPTISAAGITPYVVQQKADDGVNTPATRNITLNGEATHEVVQAMIAAANTTTGESIFGTGLIAVEDDMQAYVVKAANGMNITWAADGTFTTDADQTETIAVVYFSPSTERWSCLTLTIQNSSIVSIGHFGFAFPNFQFPLLDNTN